MPQLACSIVLYRNDESIRLLFNKLLSTNLDIQIYLVDNSPTDALKGMFSGENVEYIFNNANIGYGSGHNIAINKSRAAGIPYHLVVNPDISFENGTLEHIHAFMEQNPDTGLVMPKVFYENGEIQRLCKLLPTPADLFFRRFLAKTKWGIKINERYELHDFNYDSILNTPCLSGCFMFIRTQVLEKSGMFDPRYFMYLEDYDLVRRIHRHARTVFLPDVSITHGFQKESFVNKKLLRIHIQSAIKYFNKWGWIWDVERKRFNKEVLRQAGAGKKTYNP
jgi:GT2 family glycosyltransferase